MLTTRPGFSFGTNLLERVGPPQMPQLQHCAVDARGDDEPPQRRQQTKEGKAERAGAYVLVPTLIHVRIMSVSQIHPLVVS